MTGNIRWIGFVALSIWPNIYLRPNLGIEMNGDTILLSTGIHATASRPTIDCPETFVHNIISSMAIHDQRCSLDNNRLDANNYGEDWKDWSLTVHCGENLCAGVYAYTRDIEGIHFLQLRCLMILPEYLSTNIGEVIISRQISKIRDEKHARITRAFAFVPLIPYYVNTFKGKMFQAIEFHEKFGAEDTIWDWTDNAGLEMILVLDDETSRLDHLHRMIDFYQRELESEISSAEKFFLSSPLTPEMISRMISIHANKNAVDQMLSLTLNDMSTMKDTQINRMMETCRKRCTPDIMKPQRSPKTLIPQFSFSVAAFLGTIPVGFGGFEITKDYPVVGTNSVNCHMWIRERIYHFNDLPMLQIHARILLYLIRKIEAQMENVKYIIRVNIEMEDIVGIHSVLNLGFNLVEVEKLSNKSLRAINLKFETKLPIISYGPYEAQQAAILGGWKLDAYRNFINSLLDGRQIYKPLATPISDSVQKSLSSEIII